MEFIAVLHEIAHDLNRSKEKKNHDESKALVSCLKELSSRLGLLTKSSQSYFQNNQFDQADQTNQSDRTSKEKITALVHQRNQARKNKDYAQADAIRQQLDDMGIELLDTQQGTDWRKK